MFVVFMFAYTVHVCDFVAYICLYGLLGLASVLFLCFFNLLCFIHVLCFVLQTPPDLQKPQKELPRPGRGLVCGSASSPRLLRTRVSRQA